VTGQQGHKNTNQNVEKKLKKKAAAHKMIIRKEENKTKQKKEREKNIKAKAKHEVSCQAHTCTVRSIHSCCETPFGISRSSTPPMSQG
jgi:hypothetical protein